MDIFLIVSWSSYVILGLCTSSAVLVPYLSRTTHMAPVEIAFLSSFNILLWPIGLPFVGMMSLVEYLRTKAARQHRINEHEKLVANNREAELRLAAQVKELEAKNQELMTQLADRRFR